MAIRFDISTIGKTRRLPNGTLKVSGRLTRTGIFTYRNADGTERRELRTDAEVFSDDSLASFDMVPLTDDHPPEAVTSTNARDYTVGSIGTPKREDDFVGAPIVVYDADAIKNIEAGKVQLSCGYSCDFDPTPGEIDGEKYDGIQRNIRGNHVAIVAVGRAGPSAALRLDSDSAEMVAPTLRADSEKDTIKMDLAKALEALGAEKARADQAEEKLTAETARADKAEGERDSEKARADKAEKDRTDAVDGQPARIKSRVALETGARAVLDEKEAEKVSGMTDRDIMVAVIKRVDDVDVPTEKSDDYTQARFDSALDRAEKSDKETDAVNLALVPSAVSEADARKAMIERQDKLAN